MLWHLWKDPCETGRLSPVPLARMHSLGKARGPSAISFPLHLLHLHTVVLHPPGLQAVTLPACMSAKPVIWFWQQSVLNGGLEN